MDVSAELDAISRPHVTDVVRRVLGRPTVEVETWRFQPMADGLADLTFRVLGEARDHSGQVVGWSLVLKLFPSPRLDARASDAPTHWRYWRREALAYESGLLTDLPPGLTAPRLYAVTEQEGLLLLWLEEIVEARPGPWPLERHVLAASHLGRFNAAFAGAALPGQPWLSVTFLRDWCARWLGPLTEHMPTIRRHPTLGRYWTDDLVARTQRLVDDWEMLLMAVERLPQSLGHGDATRLNLLARQRPDGTEETVAIDWAFVGHFALGQEIAQTVVANAAVLAVEPEQLPALDEMVFTAYLEGLRTGGWTGDKRQARLAYCIDAALRHTSLPYNVLHLDAMQAMVETRFRVPYEEYLARYVAIRRFMLERADEARSLLPLIDLR